MIADLLSSASPATISAAARHRVGILRPILQEIAAAPHKGRAAVAGSAAATSAGIRIGQRRLLSLYYRWRAGGDAVLHDARRSARAASGPSIVLSAAERASLRQLALRCDSIPLAIERFADLPDTREEIRAAVDAGRATRNYPRALRRAARVTPEERDLARGNRRFGLHVATTFRKNTWIDAAGAEHPLTGGDLFECDDMSVNQPYWYEWPYGGDKLSDAFGVRLGRQVLFAIDVATGKWLGFDLVGRVRDAYRAEDVVRFLGRICDTAGVPRLGFRLERGVWAARSVRGVRGDCDDDGEREAIGSVRDAVDIHYVYSPKTKGVIEGSFTLLHSILAFGGIQIGRRRGEYERSTAAMLRCAEGAVHPAEAGFKHVSEAASAIAAGCATADARPKRGRLLSGVPDQRYAAAVAAAPLAPVPADCRHLFLPAKQVRPIDGAHVRARVAHYGHTFSFAVPDRLAFLGRGYRLLICFDPADPAAGAVAFDAETPGRRAYESSTGQAYGTLAYVPDAPQLCLSGAPRHASPRKEYAAAMRTHFRSTGLAVGTGATIEQLADGRGRHAKVIRAAADAATDVAYGTGNRAAPALHPALQPSPNTPARRLAADCSDDLLDPDFSGSDFARSPAADRCLSDALL